jgi:uncharacterized protein YecE (DUF72 family)
VRGALRLGTSGFAYAPWKGSFYPRHIRARDMLAFYAGQFRTVELNTTFRRDPTEATVDAWREAVPDDFVFAVKAHQRITHFYRLRDVEESLPAFLLLARRLGQKLGPVLYQCPPNLRFDRQLIERFLDALPSDLRSVFEFRHPSWEEARPLLRQRGVGWCVAETDDRRFEAHLEADPFGYVRLRKDVYEEDELAAWADRIESAVADGRDVYCFVKHEGTAGPQVAKRLDDFLRARVRGTAGP